MLQNPLPDYSPTVNLNNELDSKEQQTRDLFLVRFDENELANPLVRTRVQSLLANDISYWTIYCILNPLAVVKAKKVVY